jgi:5-hydroxydodecatetraenal polyketide synthase CpkC
LSLPATTVFEYPVPQALAVHLAGLFEAAATTVEPGDPKAAGEATAQPGLEFTAEAELPEEIQLVTGAAPAGPGQILLTGATGFVGVFLLRELLSATSAKIHCLVRASDEEDAWRRLADNARWYRLWEGMDPSRIVPVVGDLAAARLGLTEAEFDRLSRQIDVVYHAGATVNWLQPYPALRAANVGGTREILRLAAAHRSVPVHYLSTTGVFAGPSRDPGGHRADDPTGPADQLPSGYLQSKWVAEQLVAAARERGLPVTVHRVDLVSGDVRHGACQTRDYLWLSIKGLVQAGAVPDRLGGSVALVPVDHVARAVVALSALPGTAGQIFHLYNPDRVGWRDILGRLRAHGYDLPEMDWRQWRATVSADRDNALYPLLDAFELMIEDVDAFYPRMDTTATDLALARAGIPPARVTTDVLDTYLRFFAEVGYLPAPVATVGDVR